MRTLLTPVLASFSRRPLLLALGSLFIFAALSLVLWFSSPPPPGATEAESPSATAPAVSGPSAELTALAALPAPVTGTIASGETLGEVFAKLGVEPAAATGAVAALLPYVDPRRVRPGEAYRATFDGTAKLASFEMQVRGRGKATLAHRDGGWQTSWVPVKREVLEQVIVGKLEDSLEESIRAAGADPALAYELADVLQWDLDFTRDLRVGDLFEVVFEEIYLDGAYSEVGGVIALRYQNRGRTLEAYRYENASYYDGEGRPLKKLFLRAPLRFTHVTSQFSKRRFHPVLKIYRPHYGVDYGAPVGTPVMVTGNGTVTFAGWDAGGGKTVKVRHPGGYTTAYLHLSRFADSIRPGKAVRQGDVIAYVGATGLASGPHLDYRVNFQGTWIDPLSLTSVPAPPLTGAQMASFRTFRDAQRMSMAAGKPVARDLETRLARRDVTAGADTTTARR